MAQESEIKAAAEPSRGIIDLSMGEGLFGHMMKDAQTAFETGCRSLSEESWQFVQQRFERNSEALQRYRDCKDIPSFFVAQQRWFTDTTRDYFDEAMRMGEVARKMLANSMPAHGDTAAGQPTSAKIARKAN